MGQLDVANAGNTVVVVVKPAMPGSAERAPDVLNKMAARGPRYRVGLVPSADSRRWDFCDSPGSWCDQSIDISGSDSMQDVLDRVADHDVTVPISASQSGEYLSVSCDHGIGDSHIVFEVCAAISQHEPGGGFVEPLAPPTTAYPLAPALVHTAKATPRQFVTSAAEMLEPTLAFVGKKFGAGVEAQPAVASTASCDQGRDLDPDEKFVAVWAKSSPEFTDEIRRYRDSQHPNASVTAILTLLIYKSLEESGVILHDEVEIVVDMRRFLRRDRSTLANFYTVARIDVAGQPSVEGFSASLRQAAGSLRTLFMLAGHVVVKRLRMLAARATKRGGRQPNQPVGSTRAILTFSEPRASAFDKIAWARPEDAEIAVVSPPASRSHISVSVSRAPNGSFQITATFYASQADRSLVAWGLERALNSEAFMPRAQTISQPAV
ncbi:hypothetical protein MPRM_54800 [Mycobacterium parmense]|uniref:Uncharacterized protein n=1 Tax=Mycobacterium parmense TaxID=185642 RepID=A0A7I7Z2V3_9MYCO|nr:hypothetical protein AWC20_15255 [Mycobacterium parmense]BBZ48199.1 hypothetical protein MPRM_54800 [Mycobacterium parmense]